MFCQALACARYALPEYLDYFQLLRRAAEACERQGDAARAALCRQRMLEIPDLLDEVRAITSPLAWKIQDQPELTLPEESRGLVDRDVVRVITPGTVATITDSSPWAACTRPPVFITSVKEDGFIFWVRSPTASACSFLKMISPGWCSPSS